MTMTVSQLSMQPQCAPRREMVAAAGPHDLTGKQLRNKKMSFDDLGKVYTNISRKRILSKVRAAVVRVAASLAATDRNLI